jgi:uncharacterized phiE125 gp8 family phage protein
MRLITPPATLAVSVAEAKEHLEVEHDLHDLKIERFIRRATAHLDGWQGVLRRALEPQEWEFALDEFPDGAIALPLGPVASVTSVIYADPAGAEQTVDPGAYVLDPYSSGGAEGWVVPVDGWPAAMKTVLAVRVRYVAGTGTPPAVQQAILLFVGHYYRFRGDDQDAPEVPPNFQSLIAPLRRIRL